MSLVEASPVSTTSRPTEALKGSRIREDVYRLLDEIHDPCSVATSNPMGLVEMGIIKHVEISDDGDVRVDLRLTSPFCEMISYLQGEAMQRIGTIDGVASCQVTRDSGLEWDHDMMSPAAQQRRQLRLVEVKSRSADGSLRGGPA